MGDPVLLGSYKPDAVLENGGESDVPCLLDKALTPWLLAPSRFVAVRAELFDRLEKFMPHSVHQGRSKSRVAEGIPKFFLSDLLNY